MLGAIGSTPRRGAKRTALDTVKKFSPPTIRTSVMSCNRMASYLRRARARLPLAVARCGIGFCNVT
jgi:hypothetical protein